MIDDEYATDLRRMELGGWSVGIDDQHGENGLG